MLSFLSSGLPASTPKRTGAGVHWQVDIRYSGGSVRLRVHCYLVRPGDCRTHARDEPCERPQPACGGRRLPYEGPEYARDTEPSGESACRRRP